MVPKNYTCLVRKSSIFNLSPKNHPSASKTHEVCSFCNEASTELKRVEGVQAGLKEQFTNASCQDAAEAFDSLHADLQDKAETCMGHACLPTSQHLNELGRQARNHTRHVRHCSRFIAGSLHVKRFEVENVCCLESESETACCLGRVR